MIMDQFFVVVFFCHRYTMTKSSAVVFILAFALIFRLEKCVSIFLPHSTIYVSGDFILTNFHIVVHNIVIY